MSQPPLVCHVHVHVHRTVIRLEGAAGLEGQPHLERAVTKAMAGKPAQVLVDARDLEFLASLALGSLVTLSKSVRAGGGSVQVGGLRPAVHEVFRRSRLEELFEIVHELEELEAMLAELESGKTPASEG
jgi:anti-anti-sigma factor